MSQPTGEAPKRQPETVFLDANVLMSRVLRDYFLYADSAGLINARWSPGVLDEMTRNLVQKRNTPQEGAERLRGLMEKSFPRASVEPGAEHFQAFADVPMPDADDRHVVAAALASGASTLCTENVKDFPAPVMQRTGIDLKRPDVVLDSLMRDHPVQMKQVHDTAVRMKRGSDNEKTLDQLRKAGGKRSAERMAAILAGNVQPETGTGTGQDRSAGAQTGPAQDPTAAAQDPAAAAVRLAGTGQARAGTPPQRSAAAQPRTPSRTPGPQLGPRQPGPHSRDGHGTQR